MEDYTKCRLFWDGVFAGEDTSVPVKKRERLPRV